ncbi:hypothetical protein niasHT_016745 [Heterodera trifolii]|uniref:Uncharacterized protein n=1 Tax=Heterodera trifolii TaxID=157864 RepID=A0ABD2L6C2_9BILA
MHVCIEQQFFVGQWYTVLGPTTKKPPICRNNEWIQNSGCLSANVCYSEGVYLELVQKQSKVDVWMQNIQMALFGLFVGLALVLAKERERIQKEGAFVGYDPLVWLMTVNNTLGGLLISMVIKYADNIMKAYAQSTAAILGAAFGSWLFFNFVPNRLFAFGTALVTLSVYLFNRFPPMRKESNDSHFYLALPNSSSADCSSSFPMADCWRKCWNTSGLCCKEKAELIT